VFPQGTCSTAAFLSASACFDAAASLGLMAKTNVTSNITTAPRGCSATAISGGFEILFNTNAASVQACGTKTSSAQRVVAMTDTLIGVDLDIQEAPLPGSPTIAGSWQIAGPIDTGALVTITEAPAGTFMMRCAGPSCFPQTNGTVKGAIFNAFSIPGTIRPDNNQIAWSNGVIFNRWFPATADTSNTTMLAGLWKITGACPKCLIFGQDVTIVGGNDHLQMTCSNNCFPATPGSVTGHTLNAFAKQPGTISADFNIITWSNGVQFTRINPATTTGTVTIALSGPSDAWFGAGFMDRQDNAVSSCFFSHNGP